MYRPVSAPSKVASSPATRASLTINAVLARMEAPSVSTARRARSHGVSAGPAMPASSASRIARSTAARATSSGTATSAGTGTQTTTPAPRPRPSCTATTRAAARTSGTESGAGTPADRAMNPGRSSWPTAIDRDAAGLEILERDRHVQDRLRPGAHDRHRRSSELLEVGRDVEGSCPAGVQSPERAAMHPADPAGGEDPDPGGMRGDHRRRHGGGRPPAHGERHGEARPRGLADRPRRRRRQGFEIDRFEAHQQPAVTDGDRGRHGPRRTHRGLGCPGHLEILRIRQAVRDQGRLEGDHRMPGGNGLADFPEELEAIGHTAWNRHATSVATRLPCRSCRAVAP